MPGSFQDDNFCKANGAAQTFKAHIIKAVSSYSYITKRHFLVTPIVSIPALIPADF